MLPQFNIITCKGKFIFLTYGVDDFAPTTLQILFTEFTVTCSDFIF